MKETKEQNLINEINTDLEAIDINKIEKSFTEKKQTIAIEPTNNKSRSNSSVSYSSFGSVSRHDTLETIPFKEDELDLDLPNFASTKYNSQSWKLLHILFYSLFSFSLLVCFVLSIIENDNIELTKTISDCGLFFVNLMNWLHYKRGCLGSANLNTRIKKNVDKSFKARLLRSESGWKYFFGLIAAFILLYGDIYFFIFCKEQNPDFWNINFVGTVLISLSQILKIEKILINNFQYKVINDLSNSFVEIFLFFGSLFFSTSYLIQMVYFYNREAFRFFIFFLKGIGIFFILFSDICLIFRYFFSGYDDLNTSDISNVTL